MILFLFECAYSLDQYGEQMDIYARALESTKGMETLDPTIIERYYRDYYTYDSCAGKCYQGSATKAFIRNVNNGLHYPYCGSLNCDSNAIAHAIPVVVKFAGDAAMMDHVETAVRVVQNTNEAVGMALAAARILELVCCLFVLEYI